MNEKQAKALLVNSNFAQFLQDFRKQNQITHEEMLVIYKQYFSTIDFLAKDQGGRI